MILKSLHWSRGFTLSLFVAITLACGIRQDEFDCEDAYSHLQQCCSHATLPTITCRYEAGGCEEGPTYPALDIAVSDCIRSQSCDVIRATGMCEAVLQLISVSRGASSDEPFSCPNGLQLGEPAVDGGSWAIDAPDDDVTTTAVDGASMGAPDGGDADTDGDAEGVDAAGDAESAETTDARSDAESDGGAQDATPDRAVP
jgi:hypothetical protein